MWTHTYTQSTCQDAALEDREQDSWLGFGRNTMRSSACLPLVVSRRPPQKHDDQQYDGEEEPPERIIHPQLHPVLLINTHEAALNHSVLLQSEQRVQILTAWQSASRNFFVVQTMKIMEAETRHTSVTSTGFHYFTVFSHISCFYSPRTAKMSVLVKCLYKDSFTEFLLSFRVLMVCARLTNMWDIVKELSHWLIGP